MYESGPEYSKYVLNEHSTGLLWCSTSRVGHVERTKSFNSCMITSLQSLEYMGSKAVIACASTLGTTEPVFGWITGMKQHEMVAWTRHSNTNLIHGWFSSPRFYQSNAVVKFVLHNLLQGMLHLPVGPSCSQTALSCSSTSCHLQRDLCSQLRGDRDCRRCALGVYWSHCRR